MLAAGTFKAVGATVLPVTGLRRWDVLQAVGAKVGLDFVADAQPTAQLRAVAAEEELIDRVEDAAGARILDGTRLHEAHLGWC